MVKGEKTMKQQIDFESALSELERVVTELDGEIKLERALELFERGMKLSSELECFLKAAEQRVDILRKQSDGVVMPEPFMQIELEATVLDA